MKKILFVFFIVFAVNAAAQNNDYIIRMDGIGSLKLGMTQAELEKLLNKKIPLTNPKDTVSGSWQDSALIKYKNIELRIEFQRDYFAEDTFQMIIIGMRTNNSLCKTRTGIGIGSDKLKIIAAYEDHFLSVEPGFANYYYNDKSSTKSTISVKDDSSDYVIRFFLVNKKVVSFEVLNLFHDGE